MSVPTEITLLQTSSLEYRIDYMTNLVNNAVNKVHHIDGLRQKNFVATVAIFAGIFGFTVQSNELYTAIASSVILSLLMYVFYLTDKKLNKYTDCWQMTSIKLTHGLQELINNPNQDYTFSRYDKAHEANILYTGYKAIIYRLFLAGAPMSFLVYYFNHFTLSF